MSIERLETLVNRFDDLSLSQQRKALKSLWPIVLTIDDDEIAAFYVEMLRLLEYRMEVSACT